jgi:hypothetical protein
VAQQATQVGQAPAVIARVREGMRHALMVRQTDQITGLLPKTP